MLKDGIAWPDSRRYRSGTEWEPAGFFSDCLCNAKEFDLMLGFFSSSAISVLCDGFAAFLYNGGRMRLIVNDILTETDRDTIAKGMGQNILPSFDLSDLEALKDILSEQDKHFFECLAWLIRNERIEFKVIAPSTGNGIAHTKCGYFSDGKDKVAFDGSVNFSRTALVLNRESLTASCSWDGTSELAKILDIARDFDRTFSGKDPLVRYIGIENVRTSISSVFGGKEIETLLADEYNILDRKYNASIPDTVRASLERARRCVKDTMKRCKEERYSQEFEEALAAGRPHFAFPAGPFDYQEEAFSRWKDCGQKGLFAMATGTGKTITSLNVEYEIYRRTGYYKAIILVPTVMLVNQWVGECVKFGFDNIVRVCSDNRNWSSEVERLKLAEMSKPSKLDKVSYVIICTYASYVRPAVFASLNEFSASKLLLIADECHNIGSPQLSAKLAAIPYHRRIGLSATPERQFDDEGNEQIRRFFGCGSEYTFEFTMKEAIQKGRLCRYEYHPHLVRLTDAEKGKYMEISRKLVKVYNFSKKNFPKGDDYVKTLLLLRKAIIHKAVRKLDVFRSILEERMKAKGTLQFTLVYVPEGNVADEYDEDLYSVTDVLPDDSEAIHLIEEYTNIVRNIAPEVTVRKFTSESADRDIMLRDFASGDLQVLTSMKCLDEGVDVPRSELAIFCASTGNPRQFVQRRGRILRTHPNKDRAIIHDLVVVPEVEEESNSYEMERNMVENELKRVRDFALLAVNSSETVKVLSPVLERYNLTI